MRTSVAYASWRRRGEAEEIDNLEGKEGPLSLHLFSPLPLQGWAKSRTQGLENFDPAIAFQFCLNLPAKILATWGPLVWQPLYLFVLFCDLGLGRSPGPGCCHVITDKWFFHLEKTLSCLVYRTEQKKKAKDAMQWATSEPLRFA